MQGIRVVYTCDGYGEEKNSRSMTIDFKLSDTYKWLFEAPIKKGFLPIEVNTTSVWVLERDGFPLICSLYRVIKSGGRTTLARMASAGMLWKDIEELHFRYYPSLLDYAEMIFKINCGSHYMMWHEGFIEEYEACNVPSEIEKKWLVKYGFHPER